MALLYPLRTGACNRFLYNITVLYLNIGFTSGAVNGFILFSQLLYTLDIDASGIIVLPSPVRRTANGWKQVYQIIYGVFNLDFFTTESLSFCLWKSASALDMLAIKYVTILYTLLLIVTVIWVMNSCGGKCCGKYCRITTFKTSVIHGISIYISCDVLRTVCQSFSLSAHACTFW